MIKSFLHSGLVVRDLEKAVAFYRDAFGLEEKGRYERKGPVADKLLGFKDVHIKIVLVAKGNGPLLELIQYVNPPAGEGHGPKNQTGASHVAFTVEDIQATYKHISSKGGRFVNPPVELVPGRWACYLQDPEGNWLEIVEIKG